MKKPLFYAVRSAYGPSKVVAITTVKQHRWYGRTVHDDNPTNGRVDELRGQCEDLDRLQQRLALAEKVWAEWDEHCTHAAQEHRRRENSKRAAYEACLKGEIYQTPPKGPWNDGR